MNLLVLKLTGEIGQANGGNVPTAKNTFESAANKSRVYASVGVRFGL